ncbi:MAG TPA: hypothetical protein VFN67_39075, partial [Polyangiales bacterium]|nr:hypothetical protein [Polyangiales bacterium]
TLPRLGIRAKFAPAHDLEAVRRAIGPKTKAVFAESRGSQRYGDGKRKLVWFEIRQLCGVVAVQTNGRAEM